MLVSEITCKSFEIDHVQNVCTKIADTLNNLDSLLLNDDDLDDLYRIAKIPSLEYEENTDLLKKHITNYLNKLKSSQTFEDFIKHLQEYLEVIMVQFEVINVNLRRQKKRTKRLDVTVNDLNAIRNNLNEIENSMKILRNIYDNNVQVQIDNDHKYLLMKCFESFRNYLSHFQNLVSRFCFCFGQIIVRNSDFLCFKVDLIIIMYL